MTFASGRPRSSVARSGHVETRAADSAPGCSSWDRGWRDHRPADRPGRGAATRRDPRSSYLERVSGPHRPARPNSTTTAVIAATTPDACIAQVGCGRASESPTDPPAAQCRHRTATATAIPAVLRLLSDGSQIVGAMLGAWMALAVGSVAIVALRGATARWYSGLTGVVAIAAVVSVVETVNTSTAGRPRLPRLRGVLRLDACQQHRDGAPTPPALTVVQPASTPPP